MFSFACEADRVRRPIVGISNMLRQLSLAIAAGGLFQSTTGGATPLEPTGKWVVDYRTDQCLSLKQVTME
jgi:hypothetical protein